MELIKKNKTQINFPLIIVLSNSKGGVGKTTYCMHIISAFLNAGLKVLSMDLDVNQKSLSTYLENRKRYVNNFPNDGILLPDEYVLEKSKSTDINVIKEEESVYFNERIKNSDADIIIIDTPGDFSHRSILAHNIADIVITPINDSFVDFSIIAKIDENLKISGPSVYSNIVWEQKLLRAKDKKKTFEWFVIRNRVNNADTINRRKISQISTEVSKQLGFKLVPGFSDRVIFKDLFLYGLTLLDVGKASKVKSFTTANLAAKAELKCLLESLYFNEVIRR